MGKLYIVPTPIGNLDDITFRAVRVLKEVSLILAEDTRTSGKLMKHIGVDTPMRAFHQHNEHKVVDQIAEELEGDVEYALISDAGTPGISDPGFLLSRACAERDIPIESLPGATSFVPALVASGIPCDRFMFEGFLPHKKGRQTRMKYLAELDTTIVLLESPHRIHKTLVQLGEFLGEDRPACVCREISKMHESYHRGTLKELAVEFEGGAKGEIVLVVGV